MTRDDIYNKSLLQRAAMTDTIVLEITTDAIRL